MCCYINVLLLLLSVDMLLGSFNFKLYLAVLFRFSLILVSRLVFTSISLFQLFLNSVV